MTAQNLKTLLAKSYAKMLDTQGLHFFQTVLPLSIAFAAFSTILIVGLQP